MIAVLTKPRPMVQRGNYYGPEPRKLSTYKPEADQLTDRIGPDRRSRLGGLVSNL